MDDPRAIGARCLALHLRRAARRVGRLFDEALRPAEINNGQFSLMTMAAAREDWTMQALADALGMDQSSLSAAVKPLLRRELLEIAPSPQDRRRRQVRLTPAGQDLLDRARPLWRTAQDRAEGLLRRPSPDELRAALRGLA